MVLLFCNLKTFTSSNSKHTVYGSMSCGWTTKQLDHLKSTGQPYVFVDCQKNKCPSFVNGFPTTETADGELVVGFNKI